MPKNLTEANQFDAVIEVPVGADSRNDAAGAVERIAQRLANRTHYLNQRTGKLAAANTWTDDNTFEDPVAINDLLTITPTAASEPALHVARASSGTYQEMLRGQAGSNAADRVRVYSGASGTDQGALFFVVNARWEPSGWVRNIAGRASTALIIRDGDVRAVTKASNATQPWAQWQESTLDQFDSEMLAEVFRAARMLVTGNTYLDYTNGYRYIAPVQRISPIPLGSCWGGLQYDSGGNVERNTSLNIQYRYIWFPIPIPPFCSFGTVQVNFFQMQASQPDEFRLYKRTQAGQWTPQGSVETHAVFGPSPTTATLHSGPEQLVLDGDEWAYRWHTVSGDVAAALNKIIGLSVNWTDVGPNNRVG